MLNKQDKFAFILLTVLITSCTATDKEIFVEFNKNREFLYKNNSDTIKLQVNDIPWKSDTTQYRINWSPQNGNNEGTGIFINANRIWLHPPRFGIYRILEFCPFPEIRTPLQAGTKWSDSLVIGDHYSDSRFVFKDLITFYHKYEITGQKKIKTRFGEITCWEVIAHGISKIAKSGAKIYYHKDFGFVRMEFDCVDNTNMILNLIEIKPFQIHPPFEFFPKSVK